MRRRTLRAAALLTSVLLGACVSAEPGRVRGPRTEPSPQSPIAVAETFDDAAAADRTFAEADAKMVIVRAQRFWPTPSDRDRWVRDVAVAEAARERAESSRGTPEFGGAAADYWNAAAIAHTAHQLMKIGEDARNPANRPR